MIEILRRNPLIAALAVLCAALAAIVAFEIATPDSTSARTAARMAAPAEAKLLPPVAATNVDQAFPETVARPLWIPTRRPAPAVVAAPASMVRGQFVLQGVIIAGETKVAMLREKASGRVHRVAKGQDVSGVQVADIAPERVTLAQGGDREVLELTVQRPGAPGAPAAPPPAASGPFAGVPAAAQAQPQQPIPGMPPPAVPAPSGVQVAPGPLPPGAPPFPPAPTPGTSIARPANPSGAPMPQDASTAPMTPEELLARRRARRNQSP
jgi:hypothetical protein